NCWGVARLTMPWPRHHRPCRPAGPLQRPVDGRQPVCPVGFEPQASIGSDSRRTGQADSMIVLFTDFGLHGPYTGQMKAGLPQMAPATPVIDLFADAPAGNVKASAYLL